MEIIQIAAIGLVGTILTVIVKNYKPEYAIHVALASILVIFAFVLSKLTYVFAFLESIYSQLSYGKSYFPIILKVLAVAYLTDFVSQVCKDAGENAIAGKIELAGKVIIFYLAIPVLLSVVDLINKMLPS